MIDFSSIPDKNEEEIKPQTSGGIDFSSIPDKAEQNPSDVVRQHLDNKFGQDLMKKGVIEAEREKIRKEQYPTIGERAVGAAKTFSQYVPPVFAYDMGKQIGGAIPSIANAVTHPVDTALKVGDVAGGAIDNFSKTVKDPINTAADAYESIKSEVPNAVESMKSHPEQVAAHIAGLVMLGGEDALKAGKGGIDALKGLGEEGKVLLPKAKALEGIAKEGKAATELEPLSKDGNVASGEYRSAHQIDTKVASPVTEIGDDTLSSFTEEFKKQYGYPALKSKEVNKLKSIMSNPDADVTIYRASPKNELNNGDWVTIDKDYANDIKNQNGGKVYTHTVKASDLLYPNTIDGFNDLPSLNKWGAFQYKSPTLSKVSGGLEQEALKYRTPEQFVGRYRGSATQYGEYNPSMRKFGTTEQSARISDLGIDPELDVTIYRGVSDGSKKLTNAKIVDGDFITTDRLSAESYAGKDNVISKKVKAKDLIHDFPEEFNKNKPFETGAEFIYSDSKNKLIKYTDRELTDIWNKAHEETNIGGYKEVKQ